MTDYVSGTNRIKLVGIDIGRPAGGPLDPGRFVLAGKALKTDAAVLIYDTATGVLTFDGNGNRAGGATQIATLIGNKTLVASDIRIWR